MKAPGATLPRLTSKTKLSKSKAEEHSHAKGPPTGSILFHNFFETDLSVVTTPKFFHKMLRTFTTEAPFFSVDRDTPLTVFHKMLRTFTTEAPFFSVARDTPLTIFHKMLRTFTTEAPFFSVLPQQSGITGL